uniref:Uncharacterized protein n=1 Tax=Rhizophora mucronata TaxID=61149 RepID=A0A2P2NDX8_RHIMU
MGCFEGRRGSYQGKENNNHLL